MFVKVATIGRAPNHHAGAHLSQPAPRSTALLRDRDGVVRHGAEWLQLWSDPAAGPAADLSEQALAAAFRAVAHRPDGALRFGDGAPMITGAQAVVPSPAEPGLPAVRGLADSYAVALRWHDPALHAEQAPLALRDAFDALEQTRCEALGMRLMPGLANNVLAAAEWRLAQMGFSNAVLAADVPIAVAVQAVVRDVLAGGGELSLGLRLWQRWIGTRLAPELQALMATIEHQRAYAAASRDFLAALSGALSPAAPRERIEERADPEATGGARMQRRADADGTDEASAPSTTTAAPAPYRPYTTAHDRVLHATDLASGEELTGLRHALDESMGEARSTVARLAARLQRRLLAERPRSWRFDQEEGLLDAGRLSRVVVTPTAPLAFKQELDSVTRDTVVTLLIDCSGSMRGAPIRLAAIAADVLAQALERGGVACEVLGFTTADFAGGDSARDWARDGRPRPPGRLADLRHIVVKPAGASYRASRRDFGILLRQNLLRENVDGEALAWAAARLLARPERRRVLVVISDGAPADATTLRENPPGLLDAHLAAVVAGIERGGRIELRAIGIRHDVSRHFSRAVTISSAQALGPALAGQLAEVFSRRR